jgi:hypothetical protein
MVLQFPKVRAPRRAREAALAACHAEIVAITRSASALASALPIKKSPGRGGPEDRGLNRAWAARKRAQ